MQHKPLHNLDLTLYLIVKNEEIHLPDCLESMKGIWKELLIVDTGSTDKTKEIAKSYGARVLDFEWIEDFSAARNFALEHVQTEWVMMVDADDTIHPDDKKRLLKAMETTIPENDITFLAYIYFGTREEKGVVHYFPRIWKTSKNYRYERPIHERLDFYKMGGVPAYYDIPILHSKKISHSRSIERNLRMLKAHLEKIPNEEHSLFYLGQEYRDSGRLPEAIEAFNNFIDAKPKAKERLYEAHYNLAKLNINTGDVITAKKHLEKSILIYNQYIEPYLMLAEIEMNLFSVDRAINLLKHAKTLKLPKTEIPVNQKFYFGYADQLM
ncbi:glycosyltransferase, partial [Candidatus Peregrinibacteria bacterium]|nr:glycosyltransferase [Candidatus Peregrinibacteria bacterium]